MSFPLSHHASEKVDCCDDAWPMCGIACRDLGAFELFGKIHSVGQNESVPAQFLEINPLVNSLRAAMDPAPRRRAGAGPGAGAGAALDDAEYSDGGNREIRALKVSKDPEHSEPDRVVRFRGRMYHALAHLLRLVYHSEVELPKPTARDKTHPYVPRISRVPARGGQP